MSLGHVTACLSWCSEEKDVGRDADVIQEVWKRQGVQHKTNSPTVDGTSSTLPANICFNTRLFSSITYILFISHIINYH